MRVVRADGSEIVLRGEKILIATGSSPWRPPEFPFDDDRVHDSDELLQIEVLPKRLVVIGAGVIGSEYACTFAAMGVEMHLVDGRDVLLPFLDAEISRALAAAMAANGVRFHWNERVTALRRVAARRRAGSRCPPVRRCECDGVLVCAGRASKTGGAEPRRGRHHARQARPDPRRRALSQRTCRTSTPPATSSVRPRWRRPAWSRRASPCATRSASTLKTDVASLLPTGIYTIPEASMVGETEESLTRQGVDYVVGRARYADNPRGRIIGDDAGFLKLLFRRDDMRLLGVHVIGEQATELVHIGLIAMLCGAGAELFNRACFNYPTLGDLYKYATYDAFMQIGKGVAPSGRILG